MLGGHYTTALLARQYFPKGSLLYFLIMSQLPDLLWLFFHYLGIEPTSPDNITDVSLDTLSVNMIYSHDLLPTFGWIFVAFILGMLLFKHKGVALAGALMVAVHALIDYIGGYPHNIFGTDSMAVGTGLYYTYPYLAVSIEAVFTLIMLLWFFRNERKGGSQRSKSSKYWLIGIFTFNIVFMFSIADISISDYLGMLGMDPPKSRLLSTVPILLITYLAFIYLINWSYFIKGNDK